MPLKTLAIFPNKIQLSTLSVKLRDESVKTTSIIIFIPCSLFDIKWETFENNTKVAIAKNLFFEESLGVGFTGFEAIDRCCKSIAKMIARKINDESLLPFLQEKSAQISLWGSVANLKNLPITCSPKWEKEKNDKVAV